jgi:lipopolysaccharide transport system ATP-binding protein
MSNVIIKAEGLGKKYILSHQRQSYYALRDVMADGVRKMFKRGIVEPFKRLTSDSTAQQLNRSTKEDFWALKDVSFDIKEGDRVGIIGRNGAGKSTLLKILSRITEPTTGQVSIHGRVASLLEVGTGFHPELTGRENVYLNGAILGMSKAEIRRKFDEIVAFAEVEKFLDTPVKRYSSGMYVRLAFAVAAHLEPEILIVDEVLAVGDAQFQKKCLGKMEDVSHEGRTILFVSHNMTALQSLCSRAIWLSAGQIMRQGNASEVVSNYLQSGAQLMLQQVWDDVDNAPGNEKVRIHAVRIQYEKAGEQNLTVAMPVDLVFEFWNLEENAYLNFSVVIYNDNDVCILNSGSNAKIYKKGLIKGVCHIPGNFLNDSLYRVRLLIVKDRSTPLIDIDNLATFEVHDIQREGRWYGKWIGAVRPSLVWETHFMESKEC